MFLRPANPSAAGRPPGLLRRAFCAVRAAVVAVRAVGRRDSETTPKQPRRRSARPVPARPRALLPMVFGWGHRAWTVQVDLALSCPAPIVLPRPVTPATPAAPVSPRRAAKLALMGVFLRKCAELCRRDMYAAPAARAALLRLPEPAIPAIRLPWSPAAIAALRPG
jgi:hypothetical protein